MLIFDKNLPKSRAIYIIISVLWCVFFIFYSVCVFAQCPLCMKWLHRLCCMSTDFYGQKIQCMLIDRFWSNNKPIAQLLPKYMPLMQFHKRIDLCIALINSMVFRSLFHPNMNRMKSVINTFGLRAVRSTWTAHEWNNKYSCFFFVTYRIGLFFFGCCCCCFGLICDKIDYIYIRCAINKWLSFNRVSDLNKSYHKPLKCMCLLFLMSFITQWAFRWITEPKQVLRNIYGAQ